MDIGLTASAAELDAVQEIRASVRKVLAAVLIAAHIDLLKMLDFAESAFGGSAKAVKGV